MLDAFTPQQWALGALIAAMAGLAKTGVPGVGILAVPLTAAVFGARPSVGALLLLLIFADVFAVLWYRQHADWDILRKLIPWVLVGLAGGGVLLWLFANLPGAKDWMEPFIGIFVLVMLALHLLRAKLGDRFQPHSPVGTRLVGVAAGVSTTVANAGGPPMAIYFTAMQLDKDRFMGTSAWYFCLLNLSKVPIYLALTAVNPEAPLLTVPHALLDVALIPAVAVGAFFGKWLLPRIPQKLFEDLVLVLAAAAALKLLL